MTTTYSKLIEERNGLFYASIWSSEIPDLEQHLGNFASEALAARAVEDAVARAGYAADVQAADDKIREEQAAAEEARVKAVRDREVAAADVPDHKEETPAPALPPPAPAETV